MTAPVLPDAGTDPARYVLAVADIAEQDAYDGESHLRHMTDGHWHDRCYWCRIRRVVGGTGFGPGQSPAHTRAEVALWRCIVSRHMLTVDPDKGQWCRMCVVPEYPCADLLAVVAACQAYAGGQP